MTELRPLTFELTPSMRAKVQAWKHNCRARADSFGALYTYSFTPCGIGDSVKVSCPCGATMDLTEVETW